MEEVGHGKRLVSACHTGDLWPPFGAPFTSKLPQSLPQVGSKLPHLSARSCNGQLDYAPGNLFVLHGCHHQHYAPSDLISFVGDVARG